MRERTVKRPRREYVPVRIGEAGVSWLDMIAMEEDGRREDIKVTRSDVIRASLAVARNHEKELRAVLRGQ